jgi:hypothetical protein
VRLRTIQRLQRAARPEQVQSPRLSSLTVGPHIRALLMGVRVETGVRVGTGFRVGTGVREPGTGTRAPVTGVMPAHLPAEQVCPAAQHTCSAAHEAALGHRPYGSLPGGLPEDDTKWMRPSLLQPECSVDTQNSCSLPVAEPGALHYKSARRCPGAVADKFDVNESGNASPHCTSAQRGSRLRRCRAPQRRSRTAGGRGKRIYIPLQAVVLMSIERQFRICLKVR